MSSVEGARQADSVLAALAKLDEDARAEIYGTLSEEEARTLNESWEFRARPDQRWPEGCHPIWLLLAGRGFGKTRAGAEWVRGIAETVVDARIALVGATIADVRSVMVEGASGLLSIGDPEFRPAFYPARRLLKWRATGACAILYSAEAPEGLRGPEHHAAWGDELAKWPHAETTLSNLRMGLRLGDDPRLLLTTTPKPSRLLKRLIADPDVVTTRGGSFANRLGLPPAFLRAMERAYGGTALGRQELDGELIEDVEGALWTRGRIEEARAAAAPSSARTVIGVDPPAGGKGPNAAHCGIVVTAVGEDELAYVLADMSVAGSPETWAAQVGMAADVFDADRVVAEINNGGDMVAEVLQASGRRLPLKTVRASRGKAARAEPVAALYEAGRVRHVGVFPELEDELCGLVVGGRYAGPGSSPDRADALVWALTELMLGEKKARPGVRVV